MKILLLSLRNYLKGLKFIFTPIGILSLFLIIALSVAIPTIIESIKTMVDGVAAIFEDYSVDWERVFTFLLVQLAGQDWSKPVETFNMIISQEYLVNTLLASLKVAFPELGDDISQVGTLISQTISIILIMLFFVFIMILLGIITGFIVTKIFIKGSLRHRKLWQKFAFGAFDIAVSIFIIWLCAQCLPLGYWGIPLVFLIFFAQSTLCLFESWLIYGYKKVPIKEIFNIKNVGFLILSDLLIIIAGIVLVIPFIFTKMIVLIFIIALSSFIISQTVSAVNAEAYVAYIMDEANIYRDNKHKEEKAVKREQKLAKKANKAKLKEAKVN